MRTKQSLPLVPGPLPSSRSPWRSPLYIFSGARQNPNRVPCEAGSGSEIGHGVPLGTPACCSCRSLHPLLSNTGQPSHPGGLIQLFQPAGGGVSRQTLSRPSHRRAPGCLMAVWKYLGSWDAVPGTSNVSALKFPPTQGACRTEQTSVITRTWVQGAQSPARTASEICQALLQKAEEVTNPRRYEVLECSNNLHCPLSSVVGGQYCPALSTGCFCQASPPPPFVSISLLNF